MPPVRVHGLSEVDRLLAEELLETAVLAALEAVAEQVASRIGQVQTAGGTIAFHLPGKHDQSSHGHGGGGGPAQMHDEATIEKTYNYHDQSTGLTAEVTSIRGGDTGRSTYVDITVTDRDGNVVGQGTRTIHRAESESVAHSGFMLQSGQQGQGFMARYNQQVEESYRDHGIKRIEIHASGGSGPTGQMVGGYAWARAGYDFAPGSRETTAIIVSARFTGAGSPYSPDVQGQIARVAGNPRSSPADFAMIGWSPGASTWPGKEIMLDTSWDGVKTL